MIVCCLFLYSIFFLNFCILFFGINTYMRDKESLFNSCYNNILNIYRSKAKANQQQQQLSHSHNPQQ